MERAGRVGTLPGIHTLGASGHDGTTVGMRYVCRDVEMQSGMCGQVARVDSLNMASRRLASSPLERADVESGTQFATPICPVQREPVPAGGSIRRGVNVTQRDGSGSLVGLAWLGWPWGWAKMGAGF